MGLCCGHCDGRWICSRAESSGLGSRTVGAKRCAKESARGRKPVSHDSPVLHEADPDRDVVLHKSIETNVQTVVVPATK